MDAHSGALGLSTTALLRMTTSSGLSVLASRQIHRVGAIVTVEEEFPTESSQSCVRLEVMDLPDPDAPDDLIAFVQTAAASAEGWHAVAVALLERERATKDLQTGWLMTAFDYHLARRVGEDRAAKVEAFGEKFSGSGGTYPMPLGHLPPEVATLWASVVERVTNPAVLARLHHLLFEVGHGSKADHGRAAARAYLDIGVGVWSHLDRVNSLHWSIDLSRRLGDRDAATKVIGPLIALATESLAQEQREPGVALHALEILAFEDPDNPDLPPLLERARVAYGDDPWLTGHTIRIQEQIFRSDSAARQQLRRDTILAYYDHAMRHPPGLLRMAFLEDAAKLAGQYGIPDLSDQAVEAMQEMTIEDMDLKSFSARASIPRQVIDEHVASFVALASFGAVLQGLTVQEAPTGNIDRNLATTTQLAQHTPFTSWLPTKHLGDDGLARYTATSDEDRLDEQLARVEGIPLSLAGQVTAQILHDAMVKFMPTLDEIVPELQALPHVSAPVARSIAKGLLAFQAGNWEEATTVVMPRIETLVRSLCDEKKVLRFRVQRDNKQGRSTRGQFPQLGALLGQLRPWLDPSWYRFFWTFLVSPFGPNFRNELLHGYIDEVGPGHASLTLLAALRLALVPVAPDTAKDVGDH